MNKVRITAVRRTEYPDLMAQYEQDISDACSIHVGDTFMYNGTKPSGLCDSAWNTLEPFVEALANGGGPFYGDWMRDPHSAMLSCNDGFRPVSFYIEVVD